MPTLITKRQYILIHNLQLHHNTFNTTINPLTHINELMRDACGGLWGYHFEVTYLSFYQYDTKPSVKKDEQEGQVICTKLGLKMIPK